MRIGRIFYIFVVLLCAIETARLWNILPGQLAAHFNIQGDLDRFVSKMQFFWFQLQTILVVILVSLPFQVMFLILPPGMVNMPNREYWLAPERRVETMDRLSDFGSMLFGIILIAVQIAFDISAYANLRTPIRFDAPLMGIVMGLCFALIFALLIRLMLSFRLPPSLD